MRMRDDTFVKEDYQKYGDPPRSNLATAGLTNRVRLIEEAQDLSSRVLPPGLVVVHDAV